jgi:hypothetical protein
VAGPLVKHAQRAGALGLDVDVGYVLRNVFAVAGGVYGDDAQRERTVDGVLDGLRFRD